jgi:small subunit ribosomal protein S15
MITKDKKTAAIKSTQVHKDDVGSPAAQIAILTARINEITEHLRQHKHDFMARRGLLQMVGRRKKLLRALERNDFAQYKKVIETLGLRK